MTVYLAGPVAALDDGGAAWREAIMDAYPDIDWHNPLDRWNVPDSDVTIGTDATVDDDGEAVTVRELVEHDKRLVRESDAVLVGWVDEQSVGTPMEVMLAHQHDIPVVVWIRDQTSTIGLSPWLRYHAVALTHVRKLAVQRLQALPEVAHD